MGNSITNPRSDTKLRHVNGCHFLRCSARAEVKARRRRFPRKLLKQLSLSGVGLLTLLFVGCAQKGDLGSTGRYGVTAYNPPQGDPHVFRDVNIYGPGAIIRTTRAGYEASASALVGRETVTEWANNADANSAPYALPNIDTSSGYGIVAEGGNTASAKFAYELKAKLDSHRKTSVTASFGHTRVLNPLGAAELRGLVRKHRADFDGETVKNLRRGKSAIILQAYYTDSITYTFTQDGKTELDLSAALGGKDIAKLSPNGYRVINNKLVFEKPVFIGYAPLSGISDLISRR